MKNMISTHKIHDMKKITDYLKIIFLNEIQIVNCFLNSEQFSFYKYIYVFIQR